VNKGESKEHMTLQEFTDIDGNMQNTQVVGTIGGIMT